MISEIYTVVSKTESLRSINRVELERPRSLRTVGQRYPEVELPETIYVSGEEAKALGLGDRIKLTLEKIA